MIFTRGSKAKQRAQWFEVTGCLESGLMLRISLQRSVQHDMIASAALYVEISYGVGRRNLVIHRAVLTWIRHSGIFVSMIDVTDNAVRQLQSLLSQRPENSRKGLRVEVAKGGCSGLHYEMTLGEREEGDAIVERDGVQFFIDDESVSYLRGATLDFTDGLTGTGFRIVNPNASRTCGCGSSFEAAHSA